MFKCTVKNITKGGTARFNFSTINPQKPIHIIYGRLVEFIAVRLVLTPEAVYGPLAVYTGFITGACHDLLEITFD